MIGRPGSKLIFRLTACWSFQHSKEMADVDYSSSHGLLDKKQQQKKQTNKQKTKTKQQQQLLNGRNVDNNGYVFQFCLCLGVVS